jgi:hypothetical protein
MTRTLLLVVHIIGVGCWLGANVVQLLLSPRLARSSPEVASAWTRQIMWLAERYYVVVGVAIGITGVLLVLDGDWSWSSGFIWVGIGVLVIGAVLGVAVFGPLARTRVEALDSGDRAAADAAQRRIVPFGIVDTALVVVAIAAMVHKWQA